MSTTVPLGFLRADPIPTNSYSTLVTPSGDALFGVIPQLAQHSAEEAAPRRSLVKLRKDGDALVLEDPVSRVMLNFEEPQGEIHFPCAEVRMPQTELPCPPKEATACSLALMSVRMQSRITA